MEKLLNELLEQNKYDCSKMEAEITATINQMRYRLIGVLVEVLQNHISFITENAIESIVQNVYLKQLESKLVEINKRSYNKSEKSVESLRDLAKNGKPNEELSSIMTTRINDIHRSLNVEEIFELNRVFTEKLVSGLIKSLSNIPSISNRELEDLKYTLSKELEHVLNRESERIFEDYRSMLSTYMGHYIKESSTKLNNTPTTKIRRTANYETVREVKEILSNFGIEVMDFFDALQVKDGAGHYVPMYDNSDGSFGTKDNDLTISVRGKENITINRKDNIVNYDNGIISFGYSNNPNIYAIEITTEGYNMYYGGNLIVDPIKRSFVFEALNKFNSSMYKHLMLDPKFKAMVDEAEELDRKQTPYTVGENNRPIFNEEVKDKYYQILTSLGYELSEDEKGFYVTDENGTHRVIAHEGYITLEDVEDLSMKLDFYILANNRIGGPYFELRTRDYHLIVEQDFSRVNLFMNGNQYLLAVVDNELIANRYDENNELAATGQEVMEVMQSVIPSVVRKTSSTINNEIDELLTELEVPEQIEENGLDENPEQVITDEKIDEELEELMDDPKVRRFMELMRIKEERAELEAPSGPRM